MSLISTKNFLEPLSNKVHLVTILIVAAVFLVLRMMGGGFSINTKFEAPKLHSSASKKVKSAHKSNGVFGQKQGTAAQTVIPIDEKMEGDLLKHMMQKKTTSEKKKTASKKTSAGAADKAGLDDIEATLGLR